MKNYLENRKIAYLTLGCKVNGYETEAIKEIFRAYGTVEVPFREKADIYLVNTCTVTNIADRKSRQMLRRARRLSPDAVILATGCYVQEFCKDGEKSEEDVADIYVGNRRKAEIASILNRYFEMLAEGKEPERYYITPDKELTGYEEMQSVTEEEHSRAYIKIQDGCNQFCSYCIIPFARGRIASRKKDEILAEAARLSDRGYKEIILTGIHVSSYGLETYSLREQQELRCNDGRMPLLELLRELSAIDGIERIRLSSLEPRIITEPFVKGIAEISKVCPHFHLSLQSGCDKTLKNMNRRYTAREYADCVTLLRKYYNRPAITTDLIVGFPGETEEDFSESLAFAERIGFAQMHIFPYSRRKGTVADKMPAQLTEAVKKERESLFLKTERNMRFRFYSVFLNEPESVLIETVSEENGVFYAQGHSGRYGTYRFPVSTETVGITVTVIGTEITTDCIIQAKTVDISHKIE